MPEPVHPVHQNPEPVHQRPWFWPAMIALVAILAFTIVIVAAGPDRDDPDTTTIVQPPPPDQEAVPPTEPIPQPTPEPGRDTERERVLERERTIIIRERDQGTPPPGAQPAPPTDADLPVPERGQPVTDERFQDTNLPQEIYFGGNEWEAARIHTIQDDRNLRTLGRMQDGTELLVPRTDQQPHQQVLAPVPGEERQYVEYRRLNGSE
jgi:hypothetical protein